METTWTIHQLERQVADGLVTTAHWTVDAVEDTYSAHSYGATSFERGDAFTPYEELTKEQVVEWIKSNSNLESIEAALQSQIDIQKSPVTAIESPPWVDTPPE